MKTIKKLSAVFALTMVAIFSSCSSSSDGGGSGPASGSYITAKINGANFTTLISGVSAASASRSGTGADTLIMVLGSSLSTNSVNLNGFEFRTSDIDDRIEGLSIVIDQVGHSS